MWRNSTGILFLASFLVVVCLGCAEESDELIRQKFDVIIQDDIESLVEQIPKQSVADSVYFMIQSYENFDEGKYTRRAVVDFFFLKDNVAKVVRKYRYHAEFRKWERYFNEYKYVYDSTSAED